MLYSSSVKCNIMSEKEYVVLYTHQKTKKAKTWQDGHLKLSTGTRAILYDEKKAKLDVIHIRPEVIIPGEQLESDRYLILVEEEKTSQGSISNETRGPLNNVIQQQTLQHGSGSSVTLSRNQRAMTAGTRTGIKRRKTGFVPPRMVKPRIEIDSSSSCDTTVTDGTPNQYRNSTNLYNLHPKSDAVTNVVNLYSRSESKQDGFSPQQLAMTGRSYQKNIIYPNSSNDSSVKLTGEYSPVERPNMLSEFISKLRKSSPVVGDIGSQNSSQEQRSLPSSPWSSYGSPGLQKTNVKAKESLPVSPVLNVSESFKICSENINVDSGTYSTNNEGQLTTASESVRENVQNNMSPSTSMKSFCGNKRSALQILALLKNKESATKVSSHLAVPSQSCNKLVACSADSGLSNTSCKILREGKTKEELGHLPHENVDEMHKTLNGSSQITGCMNTFECAGSSNIREVDVANLEKKSQEHHHSGSRVKLSDNSSIKIKDRQHTGSSYSDKTAICNSDIIKSVSVNKSFQSIGSSELDLETCHENNNLEIQVNNHTADNMMNDVASVVNSDRCVGETDNLKDNYCAAQEATFHISFSPLSQVIDSDEEEDGTPCHGKEDVNHEKSQGSHIAEKLSCGTGCENVNHKKDEEHCSEVGEKGSCVSENVHHKKNAEHCSQVDEKASCDTGSEKVNHKKDHEHCSQVDEKASCGTCTGSENVSHKKNAEHCSQVDEKDTEVIENKHFRKHGSEFNDKSLLASGSINFDVTSLQKKDCESSSNQNSHTNESSTDSVAMNNHNIQTSVIPALCDTGAEISEGSSPTELHQLTSDYDSGNCEAESITHKTVQNTDSLRSELLHLSQDLSRSNSPRNTCQSQGTRQKCKQENVKRNMDTGVGALCHKICNESIVNVKDVVTNCVGMNKATGNKIEGSVNSNDYRTCMSNEIDEMSNEIDEREISSSLITHSYLTCNKDSTKRQQNSPATNTGNCTNDNIVCNSSTFDCDQNMSDCSNYTKCLSDLDWSQDSTKGLDDLEFSEDSLRMVSLSSDRDKNSASFKLASTVISKNKIGLPTIEICNATKTADSVKHGSELQVICEELTPLDQEMIPSSLPSLGESDVASDQLGDYLQNCASRTKITVTKQDVSALSHTECQSPTVTTDSKSQESNYSEYNSLLENQHSDIENEIQRKRGNCAIRDFENALTNFTDGDIIQNENKTNAIEEFKMAMSGIEGVAKDRKQALLEHPGPEVKDQTTRNFKLHEDLKMMDTLDHYTGKFKSIRSDNTSNLGELHGMPQPLKLCSLPHPPELQTPSHPSGHQREPLLQSSHGQERYLSHSSNLLQTHQSQLQSLPHSTEPQGRLQSSDLQGVPQPSRLQILPHPSDLQSVPEQHPSQWQSLPHPSDLLKSSLVPPVSQQHLDVAECANKKLQQYKMKGSVCGGKATRTPSTATFTRSGLLEKLSFDATGARIPRLLPDTASDIGGIKVTRTTPSISHVGIPATEHRETCQTFSSDTRSPCQKLEETGSQSNIDESSMFVDWNDGKPKFGTKNWMAGSPYHFVPRTKQLEQADSDGNNQQVPDTDTATCLLTRPFLPDASDIEYGSIFAVGKSHSTTMKTSVTVEQGQHDHSSPGLLGISGTCKKRNISVLETPRPKEKKALKSKPFDDPFTHTKYGKCYFSPPSQTTPVVDMNNGDKANDRKGFLPCSSQISQVGDNHYEKVFNKEDFNKENVFLNSKCNNFKTSHPSHDISLKSWSNPSNNSNGTSQNSTEQNKLQLSNSSIDSSDLELSFLGVDEESLPQNCKQICQVLSKSESDVVLAAKEGGNRFCVNEEGNEESCKLGARGNSQAVGQEGLSSPLSHHAQNSEFFEAADDICVRKENERQNTLESSKWVKYIIENDSDDDVDTSSDRSFEDRYHTENGSAKAYTPKNHWGMVQPVLRDSSAQKSDVSTSGVQAIMHRHPTDVALKTPALLTPRCTSDQQPFCHNWPNKSICKTYSSNPVHNQKEQGVFKANIEHNFDTVPEISAHSSAKHNKISASPVVISSNLGHHSLDTPRLQKNLLETPILGPAASQQKTQKTQFSRRFQRPVARDLNSAHIVKSSQRNLGGDLQFASKEEVENSPPPTRQVQIPTTFSSATVYRQVFSAALKEYLNIVLFEQAKQYHHALSKVDIPTMAAEHNTAPSLKQNTSTLPSKNPPCQCGAPSKIVQVKKSGPNQGRFFYACSAARNQQCKWADQEGDGRGRGEQSQHSKLKLCDSVSINTYIRSHGLMYYHGCEFLKKSQENIELHFKKNVPEWVKRKYRTNTNPDQKKLFVHLSKKDSSSQFTKDDLWIISQNVDFHPSHTFLARSTYYGPNSSNDLEIEPITAFSPSNWSNHVSCHCILAGNVSSELTYLSNLQENVNPTALPILPSLLGRYREPSQDHRFKAPLKDGSKMLSNIHAPASYIRELAEQLIEQHNLNADQAVALGRLCDMFCEEQADPVLLIHGVFGAGKSFLLSVMVIFLVKLFEMNDTYTPGVPYEWKVLISSTTNVAVDRILNGLLSIGFEDFVRVGSVKKISKPILPYSFHATGTDSQELKDLQEMLRSGDLSPSEKHNVKQSIEKHRLGENKKKLRQVKVVGVTCASCSANSINNMLFPVVLLDECSQMMEPASLLPIAKFSCRKLVLVGDPKQLDPTISGAEAAHDKGLEQTLFDRLIQMDHEPTMLRTQYRCHPDISRLCNTLFYNGQLQDGISSSDRPPLLEELLTLCFYDVGNGQEQVDMGHSYYNEKEADFVVFLIEYLLSRGVEPADIGVITLYKSQMFRINTKLNMTKNGSHKEMKSLRVSTVDAFQGGEHNVIILSCVRTGSVGFIDNAKRTNVALSRARHHLFIVGNKKNLSKDRMWTNILQQCTRKQGGIQDYKAAEDSLKRQMSTQVPGNESHGKTKIRGKDANTQNSELSSPPMSLSDSCEEIMMEKDMEKESTGQEFTLACSTKSSRRRSCRQINANLLDSEDSDIDLPAYDF